MAVLLLPGGEHASWDGTAAAALRADLLRHNVELIVTSPARILVRGLLVASAAEDAEAVMVDVLSAVPALEGREIGVVSARAAGSADDQRAPAVTRPLVRRPPR